MIHASFCSRSSAPALIRLCWVGLLGFSAAAQTVAAQEVSEPLPVQETDLIEDVAVPEAGPLPASSPETITPEEEVPENLLTPEDLVPNIAAAEPQQENGPRRLRFSFSGATWREVLNWLTEAGQLSLYVDDLPSGTFTYSDSQTFTVDEAVARLNLFLLPRGYSLVRRGELLSVISLGDPRSLQQLDAMAKVVPVDELEGLNDHEVVKCFVPLGEIISSEALDELQPLSLMTTPVVLPRSNQLIITETAKKLRSAVQVLDAMRKPQQAEAAVQRFDLKHVDADTVLMVAGTHLGIPEDQSSGIDITITTDLTGKRMFAVGSEEKLQRLKSLLTVIDVPREEKGITAEMTLVSHPVSGDNLQTVYDVLQTMLADQSLRLSMQEKTGTIVALADEAVHQRIRETIQELQAPAVEFAVVELGSIDPYFAVSLIGQMFGLDADDEDDVDPNRVEPPKVDADPGHRRLFVRGTSSQIEQIEQLVSRLESRSGQGGDMRFVPLSGPRRQELLQTAKQFWQGENRLQILPPGDSLEPEVIERTLYPEGTDLQNISRTQEARTKIVPTGSRALDTRQSNEQHDHPRKKPTTNPDPVPDPPTKPGPSKPTADDDSFVAQESEDADRFRTSMNWEASTPPIRSQWVPNGLLLQSDDIEALDQFENHLRQISAQDETTVSPPVVYYLKYVTADEAVKMLADLLDGANTLEETPGNTLIRGGGSGGSYFGSFLFERDGMTTVTAGTATIVSDARLNRLIVQGTKKDIATIERYMKIVDKDNSIIDVEIAGRSRMIELVHAKAPEVAELIRQAFPGRIQGEQQATDARSQQANRRRDEDERRVDDKPTRGALPTMAVAVHEPSNSLIITAPDALFAEVEKLVASVDQRSERSVRVITAGAGVNMETISQILAEQGLQSDASSQRDSRSRRDPRSNRRGR